MATRKEVYELIKTYRDLLPEDLRLTGKGVTLDYLRRVLLDHTDLTLEEVNGTKTVNLKKFSLAPPGGFEKLWDDLNLPKNSAAKEGFLKEVNALADFPEIPPAHREDFWGSVATRYNSSPESGLPEAIVEVIYGYYPEYYFRPHFYWGVRHLPESSLGDFLYNVIYEAISRGRHFEREVLTERLFTPEGKVTPTFTQIFERMYEEEDYGTIILLLEELSQVADGVGDFRKAIGKVTFRQLEAIGDEIIDEILEKFS